MKSILHLDNFKYIENNESGTLLSFKPVLHSNEIYSGLANFSFLNKEHEFEDVIDWNYSAFGKLWTYNLTYFDYLHQKGLSKEKGISLIEDFIKQSGEIKDGYEPYPTSLRIMNWIKFISIHKIQSKKIDQHLYAQTVHLSKHLEFHLLGNHLLENGLALVFSGMYFRNFNLLEKGKEIVQSQLIEQILDDGGHFELSPMYHQIIFIRLLDLINIIRSNDKCGQKEWLPDLQQYASIMYSWLLKIMFSNGDWPQVNDSTIGITPNSEQLIAYAEKLGIKNAQLDLTESGYRMIRNGNYELFADVGEIGPKYIPGHSHSDTFSFVLYHDGKPIIVDPGISTYEKNNQRQLERSTKNHNTAMITGHEQSDIWGGFRVGRKAHVVESKENKGVLEGSHNGYNYLGVTQMRNFQYNDEQISISDHLDTNKSCVSFLHFHPDVNVAMSGAVLEVGRCVISFSNATSIKLLEYDFSHGFNKTQKATKVQVQFSQTLTSQIKFI